jgi:hypothetical protein
MSTNVGKMWEKSQNVVMFRVRFFRIYGFLGAILMIFLGAI